VETYGYMFREKQPDRNVHKSLIEPYGLTLREIASLKRGENVIRNVEDGKPVTEADGSGKDAAFANVLTTDVFTYRPFEPRSFAYCSDTARFNELPLWIKGVNLLYHEATFTSEMDGKAEKTFHSTAAEAAACARDAGAGKLVMGHFSSRYRDLSQILKEAREVFPESYLAKEGAEFDIPLDKVQDLR
jgi:ribonuclease Z